MNDLEAGGTEPPLHVFRTRVWFDELDKVGVLHNARYAVHAERALSTWYESRPELIDGPDMCHLVKRTRSSSARRSPTSASWTWSCAW